MIKNGIKPGTQNTAVTSQLKDVAKTILEMRDDDQYRSKKLCATVGGCSMNTSRAANMYLKALPGGSLYNKVITLGAIGGDTSGDFIEKNLEDE